MKKPIIYNYMDLMEITAEDYKKAKAIFDRGVSVDPADMDYLHIYGFLVLAAATDSIDKIEFRSEIRPEQARNINPELPCEMAFLNSIKFILLKIPETA